MVSQNGAHSLREIAHRVMSERGLDPDFSANVIQQLKGIDGPARESDHAIRDLRSLLWCSIDNDDSRDLDQLTVAEKLAGQAVKVLVAIADVDAIVKTGSPIDTHASTNTTSVYTAAEIFPMLPEKLSTNLTSLADRQDRLSVVIEMEVAGDGSVQKSQVYRALVNNHAKLAYRSVGAWLEGHADPPAEVTRTKGLDDQLRMQDQIAQVMRSVRYQHGALNLETIEPETVLSDGQVVDLRLTPTNKARQLIVTLDPGSDDIIAKTIAERQLRCNAPGILDVEAGHPAVQTEKACDVDLRADGVAEQEVGQSVSSAIRRCRIVGVNSAEAHRSYRPSR